MGMRSGREVFLKVVLSRWLILRQSCQFPQGGKSMELQELWSVWDLMY